MELPELTPAQKKRKNELLSVPVRPADVRADTTVADLVDQMAGMSIQARNIGLCAKVLERLYADPERPLVFLGLAGPLIAAGLRKVILDLIKTHAVDVVVSTGAILYQDIYQARGAKHYQGFVQSDDPELRDLAIDRIYDTYVDDEMFIATDVWCGEVVDAMTPGPHSSRQVMEALGLALDDENSIVATCAKNGVPMFVPALNDSSIGIGLTHHRHRCLQEGRAGIQVDSLQDNYELTQLVVQSNKTAAIYVAGGVPKNYINDSIVMSYIFDCDRAHSYAIQMTTAVVHDGGLSSSTLGEAQSWGKIRRDADFQMAWVEPSVALPLLAGYLHGKGLVKGRRPLRFTWDGQILTGIA